MGSLLCFLCLFCGFLVCASVSANWIIFNALAFDRTDFIAFELHLLRRPGAEALYDAVTRDDAAARFAAMDEATRATLERTIVAGMPGRMVDAYTAAGFQAALDAY